MTTITYSCDLCKEEKDKTLLMSFWWESGKLPQRYHVIPILPFNGGHKHICLSCIEAVKQYTP